MGLLDELEKEAESKRAEEAQAAELRQAREQVWESQLLPAMKALEIYLRRFAEHLAVLKKRPRLVHPLPGYGDVVAYLEPSLAVQAAPAASSFEIVVDATASVASDECPRVVCDGVARCRSVSAVLQQHRLSGVSDARKDANGELRGATFQARGRIPLRLTVHADCDSGQARMQFDNHEGFAHSSRSFRADQMNEALFDDLARFLLREQPTFGQEAVGADVRRQLQSRIQRDQMKREWEHRLARQLADDEAEVVARLDPAARPGGLVGRLRMLSRRLSGR